MDIQCLSSQYDIRALLPTNAETVYEMLKFNTIFYKHEYRQYETTDMYDWDSQVLSEQVGQLEKRLLIPCAPRRTKSWYNGKMRQRNK